MNKTLKTLGMALTLIALYMLILPPVALGGDKGRNQYRIALSARHDGGPVKAMPIGMQVPDELLVYSTPDIEIERQTLLGWHYRNAAHLAAAFAEKENVTLQRTSLPGRVEIFLDPSGVAKATGCPARENGMLAVARIDLVNGCVYLGRRTPEDLYTELGKWFYYGPDYQWGKSRLEDIKMLRLAERFARFCLNSGNWVEAGGSAKSIW